MIVSVVVDVLVVVLVVFDEVVELEVVVLVVLDAVILKGSLVDSTRIAILKIIRRLRKNMIQAKYLRNL